MKRPLRPQTDASRALLLSCLLLPAFGVPARANAADKAIFKLSDPRGDDHGDGTVNYPRRDDLKKGDLDLLSFAAYEEDGGTRFEVTFARAINKPEPRPIDDIGTLLTSVATLGFYTFNVDVYIDTDRKPGSGNTYTLPGRKSEIDPAFAWERMVCLTPRPYDADSQLRKTFARQEQKDALVAKGGTKGSIDSSEKQEIKAEVGRAVEELVFFPKRVMVSGPTVRFFVPGSFLGGPARREWAYAVAVSVAWVKQGIDLVPEAGPKVETLAPLYIMPVKPGYYPDSLGGKNEDPFLPPLLDIIVPPGLSQEKVLADDDPIARRMVKLPAVVPADLPPPK